MNENNLSTIIDTSLKEIIWDSEMTKVENKEAVGYKKSKKYFDWSDKSLRTYKDK